MSDEPDNIVLRYLRRFDERMDLLILDMRDVKARLGSLEEKVVTMHSDIVRLEQRIDRVEDRLGRIEKRLDLIEA